MKLDKKCTIKEQESCQVEKMGCKGCYYNNGSDINVISIEKKNIEDKEIEDLNDFADLLRPEQRYYTNIIKKVIEDRLKSREKIKEQKQINEELIGAIKNLKEIVELAEEEINNNDVNVTAILDLKDLKSLQVVINKLESEE